MLNASIKLFFQQVAVVLFLCFGTLASAYAQQLDIQPGQVASFEIVAPSVIRVGEPVAIRVTARDASGNIVRGYAATSGGIVLSLSNRSSQSGARLVDPDRFPASSFRNGVLDAVIIVTRSGATEIIVEDPGVRVTARTGRIEVRSGEVAQIKIMPPQQARVGEFFDVAIELYDRFGNLVTDYDRFGGEVAVRQGLPGGVGRFEPSRISPSLFAEGRATVRLRYSQAENAAIEIEAGSVRALSSPVTIRAGELHSFSVTLPSRHVIAGEPFGIVVEAKDQGGNTITDYDRVGTVVELKTSGTGQLEPGSIPPTAFAGGVAMINVRYNLAEKISIIAEDPSGARRGESAEKIEVQGGRLGRIEIIPAENAHAGAPLVVQLLGYDIYGNFIRDYSNRNMRIVITSTSGAALEAPVISASSFRDGVALVTVTPTRAGSLVLQAIDDVTSAGGRSVPVRVNAGAVASYRINAPMAAVAHEPFEIEITAVDRFDNVIEDYNRLGSGIVIEKPGAGEISPSSMPPSSFIDGRVRVQVTYNVAEEISMVVTEKGGTARGKSSPVLITHSAPKKFSLAIAPQAVAGEPRTVTISALDDFGNPVVSYAAMNRTISLFTENGDPVAPPIISSSLFRQGVAEIALVFFKSGDAIVVAEEIGSAVSGKSSVVRVLPSRPTQLFVSAPPRAEAGVPLLVRVEMRDKLANRIRDYSPGAASLSVRVLGVNGGLMPSHVTLGDISRMVFREGMAEISVLPQATGQIMIEVRDEMLGVSGRTQVVQIKAGPLDRFRVESLSQMGLRAGEPMKLRVTALDAFGNVVVNFGDDGSGARLLANGSGGATGVFVPSTLRAEAFTEGRADIYAIYDKAEAVEVKVERVAAGSTMRPEVGTAVAIDRAGGTLISIIGNSPLSVGEARRLTESLLELTIPGAILSSSGAGLSRQGGIVSLVSMTQTEEGVRVLIHATGPAVMRAGAELNRILIDVDPVIANMPDRSPMLVPLVPSQPTSSPAGTPAIGGVTPTLGDVDRLVRENRFPEALATVNSMLVGKPNDPALMNLKRRLETLISVIRSSPSQPVSPPSQINYTPAPFVPLQPVPQPVQNSAPSPSAGLMPQVEAAVRAGQYRDAVRLLDRHIADNPDDESAIRMKTRIEQMIRILENQNQGR